MKKKFAFLFILFTLPPLRLAIATEMESTFSGGIDGESSIGDFSAGVFGPYVRITCYKCPWYLDVPFILVAEEKGIKDPSKLRESIAMQTKSSECVNAPVIAAANYYQQAAKAYPQYRKLIEKEEAHVRKSLYNSDFRGGLTVIEI